MMKKIVTNQPIVCSLCDRTIPDAKLAIEKVETQRVLCLICLIEIAELK